MAIETAAIAALREQPYFVGISEDEFKRLAQTMVERTFAKDETVFLEGEPCRGLYIVQSGIVKIFKLSPEGREQILTFITSGGSFNEVAVFDGGPNPANASAVQAAALWIVPREAISDLIQRSPQVALAVIRNLGARLRHLVGLVEDLSLRQVSSRLAKLLLELPADIDHAPTQQQIAAQLGTVREMIGRSLHQLQTRGFIRVEHGKVVIVDRDGLRKLV